VRGVLGLRAMDAAARHYIALGNAATASLVVARLVIAVCVGGPRAVVHSAQPKPVHQPVHRYTSVLVVVLVVPVPVQVLLQVLVPGTNTGY
jgi:ABC-type arginine transport system permease subunit